MNGLPWVLVALGGVLLLAAAAVWHRGHRARQCIVQLLAIPAQVHPLQWPQHARPALERAGVVGLHWQGTWFGDAVQGQWGEAVPSTWPGRHLDAGPDCRLHLRWAEGRRTNEAHAFVLAVIDVFAQAWLSRMRERTQAVAVALAQRAHVHLYWQHDMRNLAQWVGLLAEDFGSASPEQLPRLAQRLQEQAPLALARAQKLLAATRNPSAEGEPSAFGVSEPRGGELAVVNAWHLVDNAARLAGLKVEWPPGQGAASAPVLSDVCARALERALDNIFSNIARDAAARHAGQPLVCRGWQTAGCWHARLQTPRLAQPWPERPFEPLQSANGSGLGLYQARLSLREAGGDLQAQADPDGVVFEWTVPLPPGCQII